MEGESQMTERKACGRVVAIGELLIDFVPLETGRPLSQVARFERVAGGAPANVAAAVARLGGASALISQVGNDPFGDFLIEKLASEGVDVASVSRTDRARTGLSFVSVDAEGERSFAFWRDPAADMLLEPDSVSPDALAGCAALHFCSVDLGDCPMREATRRAIGLVREAGALVSFDPNVRLPLWPDADACRTAIREFLPFADVVKLSDDEVEFATGIADERAAARHLLDSGVSLVVVTRADRGAAAYTETARAEVESLRVSVVDTTGAGDSFVGALLFRMARDGMTRCGLREIADAQLASYLEFCSRYAALTVQREGAVMATMDELVRTYGGVLS